MRPFGVGLLRADFRFSDHTNPSPPSKEPNVAAVNRGYGSLRLVFNSLQTIELPPDLPENTWRIPAMKRGLQEAFRAEESKWL